MLNRISRALALSGIAALAAAPLQAQVGVVDQDNTSHDNVQWNMGFYDDLQQEFGVGIAGQLVGITLKLHSQSLAVGLPVALFRGSAPHLPLSTPIWSGFAYGTSLSTSRDYYVDCSAVNIQVTTNDVLTIRCGNAIAPTSGISLTGNDGRPNPFYAPIFYSQGQFQVSERLYFKTHVLACSGGWVGKYGAGCSGSAGYVPDLTLAGCPVRNGAVSVEVTRGLGYSVGVLLFGTGQMNVPIGGSCELWIVPFLPVQLPLALSSGAAGTGSTSLPAILPNYPGQTITMQALIYDPGTPVRMSATNGLVVRIG